MKQTRMIRVLGCAFGIGMPALPGCGDGTSDDPFTDTDAGSGTGGDSPSSGGSPNNTGGSMSATGGTTASGGQTATGGMANTGGAPSGPTSLCDTLTEQMFNQIFASPNRASVYTYQGFLQAAAVYPAFASNSNPTTCKRELAAFFANVAWETGELQYAEEINKAQYCQAGGCECGSRMYYGRGALQLTWNYNYCLAGQALGADLQGNPGLVSSDQKLAWSAGLWFWMDNRGAGSQTCHAAMTGAGGFGETIRTINGGVECNKGGYNMNDAVTGRVNYYLRICQRLGVDPGGTAFDLDC